MKKAAFVLALVMLLGCVSGCGAAEGEASVQSVSMICGLGSVGLADRFAGIVSPLGETTIKKNDAMTIDTIKVKVGDSVKKGDVLLTYDLSQIRTDLEMAQLELEQLNATLEDQQAELERIQKLMDSTYDDATKRQYALDLREQNVKVLETKANIATKKKDIEKLKANTADSTVKSPVDGEVQSLNPDGGTDNSGNALPFMTIVETGGFRIKGYVNENNASVLTEGTAVVIRSRVSDQTWKGSISSIDWNNAQQSRSDYGHVQQVPLLCDAGGRRRGPADGPACVHRAGLRSGGHPGREPDQPAQLLHQRRRGQALGMGSEQQGQAGKAEHHPGRVQHGDGHLSRDGRPDGGGLHRLSRRQPEGGHDVHHL